MYQDSLPDVRFWIESINGFGVKPSPEVFDTGNLETALCLIEDGRKSTPCNFSFIFNVRWGMPSHPELLEFLTSRRPNESRWGGLFIQSRDVTNHLKAAHAGATILRTGFEDSFHYKTTIAGCNSEPVKALRFELEAELFDIADTKKARAILFRD